MTGSTCKQRVMESKGNILPAGKDPVFWLLIQFISPKVKIVEIFTICKDGVRSMSNGMCISQAMNKMLPWCAFRSR